MSNPIPRDPNFLLKAASVASSTKPLTDRILPHGLRNSQQTIVSWPELKQVGRTGVPVTTASLRSAGAGRATKVASSPNSAPPPDGKRRTPARRRTGSCGGGGGRSPGSESRSACVEASTSGILRCRLSTMAAWLLQPAGLPRPRRAPGGGGGTVEVGLGTDRVNQGPEGPPFFLFYIF